MQGLRRYYGVRLNRAGELQIVRVRDDEAKVLAETAMPLQFEKALSFTARADGSSISATVDGVSLSAEDEAFANGGIGLIISEGALSTNAVKVGS